jgi:hypothetical protein
MPATRRSALAITAAGGAQPATSLGEAKPICRVNFAMSGIGGGNASDAQRLALLRQALNDQPDETDRGRRGPGTRFWPANWSRS